MKYKPSYLFIVVAIFGLFALLFLLKKSFVCDKVKKEKQEDYAFSQTAKRDIHNPAFMDEKGVSYAPRARLADAIPEYEIYGKEVGKHYTCPHGSWDFKDNCLYGNGRGKPDIDPNVDDCPYQNKSGYFECPEFEGYDKLCWRDSSAQQRLKMKDVNRNDAFFQGDGVCVYHPKNEMPNKNNVTFMPK
jgi:hypothetical protein